MKFRVELDGSVYKLQVYLKKRWTHCFTDGFTAMDPNRCNDNIVISRSAIDVLRYLQIDPDEELPKDWEKQYQYHITSYFKGKKDDWLRTRERRLETERKVDEIRKKAFSIKIEI